MDKRLHQFEPMWTRERDKYALLRAPPHVAPGCPHPHIAFDRVHRTLLIIEDDDLANVVVERMLAAGVPVYSHLHEVPVIESDANKQAGTLERETHATTLRNGCRALHEGLTALLRSGNAVAVIFIVAWACLAIWWAFRGFNALK